MINKGKKDLLGILLSCVDYEAATDIILKAAQEKRSLSVAALAVHGVMTGVLDSQHKYRLNHFDLLLPDGQPVRWALNLLHDAALADRVYGPNLLLHVCQGAAEQGLGVYLYGSTSETLKSLKGNLEAKFSGLKIVGCQPSMFRRLSSAEKRDAMERIRSSEASIVFVGLGCPRQEVWAYEFCDALSMPVLAVGAAFPFHARMIAQAPRWMQDTGLEWFFRLLKEPRRLWKRYILLNPAYVALVVCQALGIVRFSPKGKKPTDELLYG